MHAGEHVGKMLVDVLLPVLQNLATVGVGEVEAVGLGGGEGHHLVGERHRVHVTDVVFQLPHLYAHAFEGQAKVVQVGLSSANCKTHRQADTDNNECCLLVLQC